MSELENDMVDEAPNIDDKVLVINELHIPYTTFCVLCEGAMTLPDGAVNISRIVNRWTIHGVTPPFALEFWIAIGFRGLTPDAEELVKIIFINEDDQTIISMSQPTIISDTQELNLFSHAERFPVPKFGNYRMSVLYQTKEIGRFGFEVISGDQEERRIGVPE
ncbi:MAG: hypothetical protein ACR2OE_01440 [Thermomicrobiales bacterium]